MISNAVINSAPTTFMAMAITNAINNISAVRTAAAGTPSTWASSSCTVIASNGRHNQISNAPTARLMAQIVSTSVRLADKMRSEEHTSELQSRGHLVCRLLLETKN